MKEKYKSIEWRNNKSARTGYMNQMQRSLIFFAIASAMVDIDEYHEYLQRIDKKKSVFSVFYCTLISFMHVMDQVHMMINRNTKSIDWSIHILGQKRSIAMWNW